MDSHWGGAARTRRYFTNPPIRAGLPVPHKAPTNYFGNGYKWPVDGMVAAYPPTLRSCWPLIISRVLNKEATPSEERTHRLLQVQSMMGRGRKLAGPVEFGRWLGLSEAHTQHIGTVFPCLRHINNMTGMAPWANQREGNSPCGTTRLRVPRCEAVDVLGRAWHLPCASSHILAVLVEAITAVTQQSGTHSWPFAMPVHQCGPTCTRIRQL